MVFHFLNTLHFVYVYIIAKNKIQNADFYEKLKTRDCDSSGLGTMALGVAEEISVFIKILNHRYDGHDSGRPQQNVCNRADFRNGCNCKNDRKHLEAGFDFS